MAAYKRSSDVVEKPAPKRAKVERGLAPKTHGKNNLVSRKPPRPLQSDNEGSTGSADDFDGLSSHESNDMEPEDFAAAGSKTRSSNGDQFGDGETGMPKGNSSRESHAKQRALAMERKANKPKADLIARSKKLWERLRLKSHVPKEERDVLVKELFAIITGQVKDFVFKHDSVRVIQCAVKYATPEQRKQIARELKGEYRALAESRYAKFLIAKLVVGSDETRDMIVPEFYGHVKRLIRHPEASWIMDDIYRTIATHEQKAILLREWYGPEFVLFGSSDSTPTADLVKILEESPEKRGPIMQHLKELTNQLVQKKTTGFTMLHDALLQYFLNCKPGSSEATEFLEMLKDDEGGDCYKNLAFTKSGSRLVCLALAYGNSKDRRTILKFFKTHIKLLAADPNGHLVLLTAYNVIDDTVMSSKAIFPELVGKDLEMEQRDQELNGQAENLIARVPLLYLMAAESPKWLLPKGDAAVLKEVHAIRSTTSKKDSETRRVELVKVLSQPLLDFISRQAETLIQSSFGCPFMSEVLLGASGEKKAALEAIASLADRSPKLLETSHAGRLFKTLVQGGRFEKETNSVKLVEPPLEFHDILYDTLGQSFEERVMSWALGSNPFLILAMLEAPDFQHGEELVKILAKGRKQLTQQSTVGNSKKGEAKEKGNVGVQLILEKLGPETNGQPKKIKSGSKRGV